MQTDFVLPLFPKVVASVEWFVNLMAMVLMARMGLTLS